MSTGHDPTVVAHELTHAIFNHIRGGQSLDGFQWIAVNEGYADYFSAAFFSEPKIGRIWKVTNTTQQCLRMLDKTRTTAESTLQQEAHLFSTVWSSALWRIRTKLITGNKAMPQDVDRMILHSISHLGESSKIRMGDAATALLKSAEALDRTLWKPVIRAEMAAAEIALASNPNTVLDGTTAPNLAVKSSVSKNSNAVCGALTARSSGAGLCAALIPLALALLNLLLRPRRLKR
jgi:hypothetical protein